MPSRGILIPLMVLSIAGCGGGGGGGGGSSPTTPSTTLQISAANSEALSGQILDDLTSLENLDATTSGLAFTSSDIEGNSQTLTELVIGTAREGADYFTADNQLSLTATESGSLACDFGGQVSYQFTYSDANNLSAGDSASLTFFDCKPDTSTTLNGSMSLRFTVVTGIVSDPGLGDFTIEMTLTLTNLSINADTANGDMTLRIDSDTGGVYIATISGSSLTATISGAQSAAGDYRLHFVENPSEYQREYDYYLDSPNYSGSYTLETTQTIQGLQGRDAYTGVLVVTGANGATITFTILDDQNVRIQTDENGDGTIDSTVDTTWSQLYAIN